MYELSFAKKFNSLAQLGAELHKILNLPKIKNGCRGNPMGENFIKTNINNLQYISCMSFILQKKSTLKLN